MKKGEKNQLQIILEICTSVQLFTKLDFLSNYFEKTCIPQKTSMQPLTWTNHGKIDIMKIPAKNKL